MDPLTALQDLARELGVHANYIDGLRRPVTAPAETLVRVLAANGAPIARVEDAPDALRAVRSARHAGALAPVLVAWDGHLGDVVLPGREIRQAELGLENGGLAPLQWAGDRIHCDAPLPLGYHRLAVDAGGTIQFATILSAPVEAYRRPGAARSWGVGTQLAALRTARSRSLGDLSDLEALCRWLRARGGDVVTVLPLLPTFNTDPVEPSPYSAVSRLFWSELILDLEGDHRPVAPPATLDVGRAYGEVWEALRHRDAPDRSRADPELLRYARFRGTQGRLGRNWRAWPDAARDGQPDDAHVDPAVEHVHLVGQLLAREQLGALRTRLDRDGMRLGLDLAVGVHPDGYDTWSRPWLFGNGMSVGAPPDLGFPSGQDWGFAPVLPEVSRREGHRYLAAAIGHQMQLAGVLRFDHVMALTRLYWIPHGFGLDQGTYVSYPAEELFALVTLESVRHRSEVVGENLGTVPPEIDAGLPRHRIWGMYLAQFAALSDGDVLPPTDREVALLGTHDTPTLAGWMAMADVPDRLRHALLRPEREQPVREERAWGVERMARLLGVPEDDPAALLEALLEWLGRSPSPLVVPWLEDLWLEPRGVNLPGTRSDVQPNWQRPMARLLDDVFTDSLVEARLDRLHAARTAVPPDPPTT